MSHEGVHGRAHESVQSSGRGSLVLFSPVLFVGQCLNRGALPPVFPPHCWQDMHRKIRKIHCKILRNLCTTEISETGRRQEKSNLFLRGWACRQRGKLSKNDAFLWTRHEKKILNVQNVIVRKLVVISQAPKSLTVTRFCRLAGGNGRQGQTFAKTSRARSLKLLHQEPPPFLSRI